jgi:hypothetical protein
LRERDEENVSKKTESREDDVSMAAGGDVRVAMGDVTDAEAVDTAASVGGDVTCMENVGLASGSFAST